MTLHVTVDRFAGLGQK
jgi:hypothetical protein